MIRKLAGLLILIGLGIFLLSGYNWWNESRVVVNDPELSRSIATNWDNTSKENALVKGIDSSATKIPPPSGEEIGKLTIPRLGFIYPIVQGTDDKALKKGVGMYVGYGTVKAGQTGHVVLSGHRDTVFAKVGQLKIGDRVYLQYHGYVFTYQIRKTWIADAEDRTVIVPNSKPILSITTCYPFNYIGSAPYRYIIRAELIEIKKDNQKI